MALKMFRCCFIRGGSPRNLTCLVFLITAGLIFGLGFWNGHESADRRQSLPERESHLEKTGGVRKLQRSAVIKNEPSDNQVLPALSQPSTSTTQKISFNSGVKTASRKLDPKSKKVIDQRFDKVKQQKPHQPQEQKHPLVKDDLVNENEAVREAILDVREVDIGKSEPKKMNRTIAKQMAIQNGVKQLPSNVLSSIFSFTSLRHSKNSLKNPIKYGSALALTRMAMELGDLNVDISSLKPPTEVSPAVNESLEMLQKFKLPLESATPGYNLGDMIPSKDAKHILVITSWRSGSTFLGDILNHYPGTFYTFEPLHYLSRVYQTESNDTQILEEELWSNLAQDAIELMSTIYKCEYDQPSLGFLAHVAQPANQFLFKHNFRIWNTCSTLLPGSSACFMPEFYREVCPLFPIRLMKTVRLRVPYIQSLVRDPDIGPRLKIVMLVRDPRGTMTSRSAMTWCENPHCSKPEIACNDLDEDLEAAAELKSLFPDQVTLIRYEDLSLEPFETTDKLLEFLELGQNPLIDKFLETHTNTKRRKESDALSLEPNHNQQEATTQAPPTENPYSTNRDSKATAFAWKTKIDFEYMQHIQQLCHSPMEKLGYRLIRTQEERDDPGFPILAKSAHEISLLKLNQEP